MRGTSKGKDDKLRKQSDAYGDEVRNRLYLISELVDEVYRECPKHWRDVIGDAAQADVFEQTCKSYEQTGRGPMYAISKLTSEMIRNLYRNRPDEQG